MRSSFSKFRGSYDLEYVSMRKNFDLQAYSELISLAEKDTSNVSSQGIPTTGTTRERHSQRNSGVLDSHDLSSHETPSTSFMNKTPAGRRSQPNVNGFQRSVLTKLETLINKQEET
ncbi:uncharacterized protein LOC124449690 isoform X2 [Xenia sp. Carnegie-2017]|uniref:uncharacterized protein LOC124449690 isoform X2 n=1 Tax=Xenia sp. Carnegie-2017 TaxID=2897299 RepID=UPI001F046504|nr:uncharacterized protein LOC124449690 isoform X2 [Xenia sp. Carnegie-2017]